MKNEREDAMVRAAMDALKNCDMMPIDQAVRQAVRAAIKSVPSDNSRQECEHGIDDGACKVCYQQATAQGSVAVIPQDWKLVPFHPTKEMRAAGAKINGQGWDFAHHTWYTMLLHAPAAPAPTQGTQENNHD